MFVNDDYEALACGIVASGTGVVGATELVVCSVEEPLEHHRVRYAGEVPLRIPVRSRGRQLTGRVMVRLVVVVAMRFWTASRWWPGSSSYAATSVLTDEVYDIVVLRIP
jgi:hypothetical protein